MSVRIDGCMEIQRWLMDNYDDVSAWISDEKYSEYLEYKRKQELEYKRKGKTILILLLYFLIVLFIILIDIKLLGVLNGW